MSSGTQSVAVEEATETTEEKKKGPPGCRRIAAIRSSARMRAKAKDRGAGRAIERNWQDCEEWD